MTDLRLCSAVSKRKKALGRAAGSNALRSGAPGEIRTPDPLLRRCDRDLDGAWPALFFYDLGVWGCTVFGMISVRSKRMDWIGVPVSCAIIVLATFTLFVEGGIKGNPLAAFAIFALWVGMSLIAIHAENKKRFISPLLHLEQVLDDLKNS
jgi:hypothetical protein